MQIQSAVHGEIVVIKTMFLSACQKMSQYTILIRVHETKPTLYKVY